MILSGDAGMLMRNPALPRKDDARPKRREADAAETQAAAAMRRERLQAIKAAIRDGRYTISAEDLARKILDRLKRR